MSALAWDWTRFPEEVHQITSILVPLDGSVHAMVAMPIARVLAELESAPLHVVHVGDRPITPRDWIEQLGIDARYLDGAVVDQVTGDPAGAILRLASGQAGSLIVMCTHTGSEKPHGAIGRVAEAVLSGSPVPMILVQPERGQANWKIRRVLLPHDGTPSGCAALAPASGLAQRSGAELLVVHVGAGPEPHPPREAGTLTAPLYIDQPQHEWAAWAHEFLQRMRGLGHTSARLKLRLFVMAGEPGPEIVRFAREHQVDLVVLARHGDNVYGRAETLTAVVQDAGSPVLVLPASP